jgi:hypothetical protein
LGDDGDERIRPYERNVIAIFVRLLGDWIMKDVVTKACSRYGKTMENHIERYTHKWEENIELYIVYMNVSS